MKRKISTLLTCGPRLCEIKDFLECHQLEINEYRIHLGKTNRNNLEIIHNLLETQRLINHNLNIYLDIPTSRPRLGKNLTNANNVTVFKGQKYNIIFQDDSNWKSYMYELPNNIYVSNLKKHKKLISKGNHILLKDGNYSGIITMVNNYGMEVMCTTDTKLYETESISFPDIHIEYDTIDEGSSFVLSKIKNGNIRIDKFILSFCHNRNMISDLRKYLIDLLGYEVYIMAKIEDRWGVLNACEIITEADAIMIGRGDLGISVGFENLPKIQKKLIFEAKSKGKPVYVATQFLEELAQKNHLCSPELNDIYLAIIQGADGIMLSGEAGASLNSKVCITVLWKMINYYNNVEVNMNIKKRTQILATMGPTLQSVEDATAMIRRGVYQFRIHMGLRNRDFCAYYRNALKASKQLGKEISILLDLPSTRPRVVDMDEYTYKEGELAYIFDAKTKIEDGDYDINIPLPDFIDIIPYINIGEHIMFRDGHVIFEVKEKFETKLLVQCNQSDLCIRTGASSCFPESDILFQPISEIDLSYLKKMKEEKMCPDRVAISFASTVAQIDKVREDLEKIWPDNHIELICKIENKIGLRNIDDLIKHSDGIMVARGDLLLCIDAFEMPKIQMNLAKKCVESGRILIIGTEFFERYAETGIVNRAELSDVALAIRQGADSIMLARETGNSVYNLGCVELINAIIANEIEETEFPVI